MPDLTRQTLQTFKPEITLILQKKKGRARGIVTCPSVTQFVGDEAGTRISLCTWSPARAVWTDRPEEAPGQVLATCGHLPAGLSYHLHLNSHICKISVLISTWVAARGVKPRECDQKTQLLKPVQWAENLHLYT